MRIALQGDPQVTFELRRMDFDPWDIRRVPAEDEAERLEKEPAQEKQNDCRRNETAPDPRGGCEPWARMLRVDPFAVRFTHDRISPSFRDGTPLDSTIIQLLEGKLWHKKIPSIEIVEHQGKWYSLSNRRLYVFRVVANWWPGFRCRACLYSFNHFRVQKMAFDIRLGREETKWVRAYSTMSDGKWVHVYSRFRWFQTKWVPRQTITEHQDASVHHNESSTEDQPLPETTRLEDGEKRLTDSSAPKSELLDDKGLEVNDKEELLGPLPKSEETDVLQPGQWEQHESGKDIEEPETWQQLVMGAGKARLQEPLEEPPPEKPEASRACKGHNKIPKKACYQSSLRTPEQGQRQIWTLNVVWDMGR